MDIKQIEIAANRGIGTDKEKWIPGDLMCLDDPDGVARRLRWLGRENTKESAQILCRPKEDERCPLIFLDDVPKPLAMAIGKKYQAIIVETSPDNCHVWMVTTKPLSGSERNRVQRALASKIGADRASTSGDHFGRLPGFRNRKPGRGGCWTNLVALPSAESAKLDPAPYLSSPEGGACSRGVPSVGRSPAQGYAPLCGVAGGGSESEKEFAYAIRSLAAGVPDQAVAQSIAGRALARGKRRTERAAWEYAWKTIGNARNRLR